MIEEDSGMQAIDARYHLTNLMRDITNNLNSKIHTSTHNSEFKSGEEQLEFYKVCLTALNYFINC